MTLERIMFDHLRFNPFAVTIGHVRAKVSFCTCILDDVVIHEVFKGDVFEFIGLGRTKSWIVLCELRQYWFEFFAMYKTSMSHANVMKKVLWERI